ncbi:hypothetical protein D3C76_888420 [compost metagenome]
MPLSSVCHLLTIFLNSDSFQGVTSHLPVGPESIPMSSNWNTILSSPRSSPANKMASSVVTSHVSPTVMTSYFDSTSRFISCINSCTRGPLIKPLSPSFESGKPGTFEMRLMTSMRKPSIPLSSHHVIMSYTSRRTFSFSQFRSGCFLEKICK